MPAFNLEVTTLTPAAIGAAVFLVILSILSQLSKHARSKHTATTTQIASAGKDLDYRVTADLSEAARRHPDRAVRFTAPLFDKLILPSRYADELKDVPESAASFERSLRREFAGGHTGIGQHHAAMTRNLQDLNRHGNEVVALLVDELAPTLAKTVDAVLGAAVPAGFQVLRIIAQMSGRVFVGLPLARDERWIGMNIGFLFDSFGAAAKLTRYPAWWRPVVAWYSAEGRALAKHRADAVAMLKPLIEQRIRENGERKGVAAVDGGPADMIQWTLANRGSKARTAEEHMEIQLALLSVSLLGTTILTTFVLYELAAHPESVPALREESRRVRDENGGALTKGLLPKLRKLDSFIKETQRLDVTTAVMLNRMMRQDVTLSDGTLLAAGMDVAVNAMEVNRSEELWANPDVFDGFRFDKLRREPGAESKHQLIKSDLTALSFGLGGQVCPGRFFAGAEMKVILSQIILDYDVKFKDEGLAASTGNFTVEDVFMKPKELIFQKRGRM